MLGTTRASPLLVSVRSFEAKEGKGKELEALLGSPETGARMARALGATRNALFFQGRRMIRFLEFPEEAELPSMAAMAQKDPDVAAFLRKLAPLIEDAYDPDDPESMAAFDERVTCREVFDVRV